MQLPEGFSWITGGTLGLATALDPVQTAAAKALLASWGLKEQPGTYPSDYGGPQDLTLLWTDRDGLKLHAFAVWWNNPANGHAQKLDEGKAVGPLYYADLTLPHLQALQQWAGQPVSLPPSQFPQACPVGQVWNPATNTCVPITIPPQLPPLNCPAGQYPNLATGKCEAIPTLPPSFQFPTMPLPTSQPSPQATQCGTDCATKFAGSPVQLLACLNDCAQKYGPTQQPGGQQPPLPAPPCGGPCPKGQVCVNGKCVPQTAAPSSSTGALPWLIGGAIVLGGVLLLMSKGAAAGAGGVKENPRRRSAERLGDIRSGDTVVVDGSVWNVLDVERGQNPQWVSLSLEHDGALFYTGGWQSSKVSSLHLTTEGRERPDEEWSA